MDIGYGLVLLLGLAVWRVTYMLSKENGPLTVFARLRAHLARKQQRPGGLFDMISCSLCLSVWVAMIPALLISPSVLLFVVYTLVMSAEAIFLQKLFDKWS